MKESTLLTADAAVNLLLGIPLVFFPQFVFRIFNLPIGETLFLPTVLGGVLTGIGIALLIERFQDSVGISGLGLGGAISINVCGAGVLVVWLLQSGMAIPLDALIILWVVAMVVLGISAIEFWSHIKQK